MITLQEFYDVFIARDFDKSKKFYVLGLQDTKGKEMHHKDLINVMLYFESGSKKMLHSTGLPLKYDFEYYHEYYVRFGFLEGYVEDCYGVGGIKENYRRCGKAVGHQYYYSHERKLEQENALHEWYKNANK